MVKLSYKSTFMYKLEKAELMREVKDYIYITLGLISYSLGWAVFLVASFSDHHINFSFLFHFMFVLFIFRIIK